MKLLDGGILDKKGRGVGGHREEEERDGSETDLKKIKKNLL